VAAHEDEDGRLDAILTVENAAVHYGGIRALDGVSFGIGRGLITGILGPNGSGKTTLLGALTRLVSLTTGRILFNGEDYTKRAPHHLSAMGVSRTFQTVRLLPELNIESNIALGTASLPRAVRRTSGASVRAEAIERAGLTNLEKRWPDELPYGLQRRVEIARALAMRPQLLLLDEPMAGMNRSERKDISTLLKELRAEGLSQLLVEHDVGIMVDTCDMLIAMNFGKVIAIGTPDKVVQHPDVREAYLGKRGANHA